MSAVATARSLAAADRLLREERTALAAGTTASRAYERRAVDRMPRGVASDFQRGTGALIVLRSGDGAYLVDVDGNRYVDFHAAAGAALAGHRNVQIAEAIRQASFESTCLAAASPDALPVLDELARRFGHPRWRPVNSGTEATLGAVRLARAVTGRERIVKLIGAYNGHHDSVLVDAVDPGAAPGVPTTLAALTRTVPYDDVQAIREALSAGDVACVVAELPLLSPVLRTASAGYHEALRALCDQHSTLLVADEVKTGIAVDEYGAQGLLGVRGHIVAAGKSFAGGLPCGAIGGEADVMDTIDGARAAIYGTFNGNPLVMSAASAMLTGVMNSSTHARIGSLARRLVDGASAIAAAHDIPLRPLAFGGKGTLIAAGVPDIPTESRPVLAELVWTFCVNRGVFLSPAPDVRWTITAAHRKPEVDRVLEVLDALGQAWRAAATTRN